MLSAEYQEEELVKHNIMQLSLAALLKNTTQQQINGKLSKFRELSHLLLSDGQS